MPKYKLKKVKFGIPMKDLKRYFENQSYVMSGYTFFSVKGNRKGLEVTFTEKEPILSKKQKIRNKAAYKKISKLLDS